GLIYSALMSWKKCSRTAAHTRCRLWGTQRLCAGKLLRVNAHRLHVKYLSAADHSLVEAAHG
ncbi:MAG: hypothetical protein MUQ60_03725, partial [Porticoccaceae bacterium]|nr:hypothetical protein [Porticoccaceae bacterium]